MFPQEESRDSEIKWSNKIFRVIHAVYGQKETASSAGWYHCLSICIFNLGPSKPECINVTRFGRKRRFGKQSTNIEVLTWKQLVNAWHFNRNDAVIIFILSVY